MIEIVNPKHPDKVADRIAGAIVDLAYKKQDNPKVAVEVLIGHGECNVIIESSTLFDIEDVEPIVQRIAGEDIEVRLHAVKQDEHLAENQSKEVRCGDNGIFTGAPLTLEELDLYEIAKRIYDKYSYDGKYILDDKKLIVCQSNVKDEDELFRLIEDDSFNRIVINPLGYWTGGTNVDTGATNRKLGSDMGHSVSGGGLSGKDLSKADVSINIYAWLKAQQTGKQCNLSCAIGDKEVDGRPYSEIVEIARKYIDDLGGFEKFSEWGFNKIYDIDFEKYGL